MVASPERLGRVGQGQPQTRVLGRQVRIALYGATGVGKSTAASIIEDICRERHLSVERCKLAAPLYRLQRAVYRECGRDIDPYGQDQVLLESLARHMRRISPSSLADDLERRLARTPANVVVNDDLRDVEIDYPRLRRLGFVFVRIDCEEGRRRDRLRHRGDLTTVIDSSTTGHIQTIEPYDVVDNHTDDVSRLRARLATLLAVLVPVA